MSAWDLLWWVTLPYTAVAVFVVGHIWRWRYDQFGWTSRSTQLHERRLLKWGSPLFHYATFAAIGGHVLGLLVPESWTRALGIPERAYMDLAVFAGGAAAFGVIIGGGVLLVRRLAVARVHATTDWVDYFVLILLGIFVILGAYLTVGIEGIGGGYDYRTTVSVWFRGLLTFNPNVGAITTAPFMYQLHSATAWLIIAVWPFTRLVHVWNYPLWYLWRPYVVIRSRIASHPHEPGTGGRKWRKIGVPY